LEVRFVSCFIYQGQHYFGKKMALSRRIQSMRMILFGILFVIIIIISLLLGSSSSWSPAPTASSPYITSSSSVSSAFHLLQRQREQSLFGGAHCRGSKRLEPLLYASKRDAATAAAAASAEAKKTIITSTAIAKQGTRKSTAAKKTNKQSSRTKNRPNNGSQTVFRTNTFQLNKGVLDCESAMDILKLIGQQDGALTGLAGGGALNSVNFSTAIHRIARYLNSNPQDRSILLTDPKFALFLSSLSEAIAGMDFSQPLSSLAKIDSQIINKNTKNRIIFGSRERTNILWSLAKLKFIPPKSTLPVQQLDEEQAHYDLLTTSYQLRKEVLESTKTKKKDWIPTLSLLGARLMDAIASSVLQQSKHELVVGQVPQEMSNFLWSCSSAQRTNAQVFETIVHALCKSTGQIISIMPNPQEFSNTIWAFAKADIQTESQTKFIAKLADILDEDPDYARKFKPQEISNTAWGLATMISQKRAAQRQEEPVDHCHGRAAAAAKEEEDGMVLRILRHVAREITRRTRDFKSQELSNAVWSFATLGFGISEQDPKNILNDYIFLETDDLEGDKELVSKAMMAVAKSSRDKIGVFREQELNNLAWSYARLGQWEETELFEAIGREFSKPWRRFDGQDVGTTLWSFATMEYVNNEIMLMIASRLRLNLIHTFKPQELSNVCWALATGGIVPKYIDAFDTTLVSPDKRPRSLKDISDDPITMAFASAAQELMRRPEAFKTQEIKDILWAFSKIGMRHPALFKFVAEHLVGKEEAKVAEGELHCGRGFSEFSSQGKGNLIWSFAKQAQLSEESSVDTGVTGRLAVYCVSSIDIGEGLIKRLANALAGATMESLGKAKPNDISNICWALATLGFRHTAFLDAVVAELSRR
jgi:hypothetical protein